MRKIKLRDIRGIGPSVEEKLLKFFKNEQNVLTALHESRIAEISSIEGIGERFALSLCRNLHYQETNEKLETFLKTEDAILLYNRIIEIISHFGNTSYARSKLFLFYPLPISLKEKILERQGRSKKALELVKLIEQSNYTLQDYNSYLKAISPLKEKTKTFDTASRLIATTEKHIYNEILLNEVGKHCEVIYIEDIEQVPQIVYDYDEIIWIGSDILLEESYPNVINISESKKNDIVQIIPEKILQYFGTNKRTLVALSRLANLLQSISPSVLPSYIGDLDLSMLIKMGSDLNNLDESGEPNQNINVEYLRLFNAEKNFEIKLTEIQMELNDELQNKLQGTTVELGGEKILALLKNMSYTDPNYSGNGVKSDLREYLDDELHLAFEEIITTAEEKLIIQLDLKSDEIEYFTGIFPRELRFPIDRNEENYQKASTFLRQKRGMKAFELKVKIAKSLEKFTEISKKGLNLFLELDYLLMIGRFTQEYKLVLPKMIDDHGTGLVVEESRNLFLCQQELRGKIKVSPVSYALGEIGVLSNKVKGERVILLSGANSGGKTSLLVSIGIIIILGHMGLPIPCREGIIGGFNEFHYYRKSSGQMDAGAFESTLKTLSNMIMSPKSRLVLADEMESISEPGASARVIAAVLDLLNHSPNSVGVFVTHLAQEIAKYNREGLRIDGIEAQGLSDDLELLVNRTPIYYKYAKSTPELIVRRLEKISKGEEKAIYSYILKAFDS